MSSNDSYIIRGKVILSISTVFLIVSMVLFAVKHIDFNNDNYIFAYESIDIKTMGIAKVAIKTEKKDTAASLTAVTEEKNATLKEIELINTKNSASTVKQLSVINQQPVWRLPTERGYITQQAHYYHVALDITSPRGTNETIYPIADGVITSITHDTAGAKIVTVNHYINGQYYTSQYVHLAWFDGGIYVGKQVTTNDPLGAMGTTGISTGVHLHIALLDCNLYDPNDYNCSTLNGYYNYGRKRMNEGFRGLSSVMNVPYSWTSR